MKMTFLKNNNKQIEDDDVCHIPGTQTEMGLFLKNKMQIRGFKLSYLNPKASLWLAKSLLQRIYQ